MKNILELVEGNKQQSVRSTSLQMFIMISLGRYLFVFSVHVNILSLLHILQSSDNLDKQSQDFRHLRGWTIFV